MRTDIFKRASIRRAGWSLRIEAAIELWPFMYHAVSLPAWQFNYHVMLCSCQTRDHRRKDCEMKGTKGCHICGATFADYGAMPQYCPGCMEWWETRSEYLGEWALANLPQTTGQMRLDMPAYDFSGIPRPDRPFLTDSPAFGKQNPDLIHVNRPFPAAAPKPVHQT